MEPNSCYRYASAISNASSGEAPMANAFVADAAAVRTAVRGIIQCSGEDGTSGGVCGAADSPPRRPDERIRLTLSRSLHNLSLCLPVHGIL